MATILQIARMLVLFAALTAATADEGGGHDHSDETMPETPHVKPHGLLMVPLGASGDGRHQVHLELALEDNTTIACTLTEKGSASESGAQFFVEHATGVTSEVAQDAVGVYQCNNGATATRCAVSTINGETDGLCFKQGEKVHFHQAKPGGAVTSNDPFPSEMSGRGNPCMIYPDLDTVKAEDAKAAAANRKLEAQDAAAHATGGATAGASNAGGTAGRIQELKALRDGGDLTDQEFHAAIAAELHIPKVGEAVQQWTNCYHQDTLARRLSVGVAMTSRLAKQYGTQKAAQWIATQLAETNLVFREQFNVILTVGDYYIVDGDVDATGEQGPKWNSPTCALTINQQLVHFKDWVHTLDGKDGRPRGHGVWHLFDDCFRKGAGLAANSWTIGLAYVGTLCRSYNAGVTYTGRETWKTFAHEIGHNFGADHSFEEGQGKTGGIMDYGDGKLDGEYQPVKISAETLFSRLNARCIAQQLRA